MNVCLDVMLEDTESRNCDTLDMLCWEQGTIEDNLQRMVEGRRREIEYVTNSMGNSRYTAGKLNG